MRAGRATAIAIGALLLAPASAAALTPLLAPRAAPAGCQDRTDLFVCAWSFTDEDLGLATARTFEIPAFDRTIATMEVELIGRDEGWDLRIERMSEEGEWIVESRSHHAPPAPNDLAFRHSQQSSHVLFRENEQYRIRLDPGVDDATFNDASRSAGRWSIAYKAERVPEGTIPYRAAADAARPHLVDLEDVVPDPSYDLLAAWITDDRLDDGLLEAHIQLRSLLFPVPLYDEQLQMETTGAVGTAESVGWKLAWELDGLTYFVEWMVIGTGNSQFRECELRQEVAAPAQEPVLAKPLCDFNATTAQLHAVFPQRSIGAPADGELFEGMAARTRVVLTGRNEPDVVDDATVPEYLFALGGPAVWAQLDGGALGPAAPAWYQAPFAEENIVDSFQVLASILAAITFLVGLALVSKRKRRTNALLHRIDDAIRGEIDSRETLLRLGRLESDFSDMYRRGRLTEGQYQVLSQRIATVATRHSLRHSLGLDDGVPGDESPVRIDIADGPKKRIRP